MHRDIAPVRVPTAPATLIQSHRHTQNDTDLQHMIMHCNRALARARVMDGWWGVGTVESLWARDLACKQV